MKIPSCFYGTHKKVKAEVTKLYTQIKKKKPLEEIFSKFELLDVNDYPVEYITKYNPDIKVSNNLIWIRVGVPFSGGLDNFILSAFSDPLYRLWKFNNEERYEMELRLIPFLATTEWGCVILNNEQANWYWSPKCGIIVVKIDGKEEHRCPVDPDFAFSILESSAKYWDNLLAVGNRFFDQFREGTTITKCRPLCYWVLNALGCEMERTFCEDEAYFSKKTERVNYSGCKTTEEFVERNLEFLRSGDLRYFKFGHVKDVCEKYSLFDKLKNDEDFRRKALEGSLFKGNESY